jgi:hypothetical protein
MGRAAYSRAGGLAPKSAWTAWSQSAASDVGCGTLNNGEG